MGLDIFKGLANAPVFERGVFLNEGTYTLEIEKALVKETRKSGNGFIVEFRVLDSTNARNPANTKASWFQKLLDKDIAFGAIKEFMYAALGYDYNLQKDECVKKIDPKIEQLVADAIQKNSLKGIKIGVTCTMKKTQNGKDFTVHTWFPAAA